MRKAGRIVVVALLVCAVGAVLAVKRRTLESRTVPEAAALPGSAAATSEAAMPTRDDPKGEALPRLVDLGAGKCIPCRKMAPILEELRREYAGKFDVQFIDVWQDPEAGAPYDIRMIPTQIFFDAQGQELFRHEGFFGKEDILGTWKKYGVAVAIPAVK